MNKTRQNTTAEMMKQLSIQRLVTIVLIVILVVLIVFIIHLSTLPLLRASRSMAQKEKLPVTGSKEFRQLAENYNQLLDQQRQEGKEQQ